MSKLLNYLLFALISINFCHSQTVSGEIDYKVLTKYQPTNEKMNTPVLKMVMKTLKSNLEKEYRLEFNFTESLYIEVEKLSSIDSPGNTSSGYERLYKDIENKIYRKQSEFLGKRFLIKDSLQKFNWQLQSETKEIMGYTCRKAVTTQAIVGKDLVTKAEEIEITGWFCIDIPISNGPMDFWGLPGIILEINTEAYDILCSSININFDEERLIKIPNKGESISQKEYDNTVKEKLEEIKSKFKS